MVPITILFDNYDISISELSIVKYLERSKLHHKKYKKKKRGPIKAEKIKLTPCILWRK